MYPNTQPLRQTQEKRSLFRVRLSTNHRKQSLYFCYRTRRRTHRPLSPPRHFSRQQEERPFSRRVRDLEAQGESSPSVDQRPHNPCGLPAYHASFREVIALFGHAITQELLAVAEYSLARTPEEKETFQQQIDYWGKRRIELFHLAQLRLARFRQQAATPPSPTSPSQSSSSSL